METKQQIDHLIELAIVQRAELKRLVEQLPVLRTYLLEQINATIEDMEPQLRSDLIEFCDEKTDGKIKEIRSFFSEAKSEFATKSEAFFVELEKGVQSRYAQLAQERALALDFADDARKGLEAAAQQEAAKIPGQVSELVKQELARFPRAGELDQLRKEFSEPRGLNPRGKWKSTETYQKLDLVAYNGDSYVSNVNDNREKPSRSSLSWTLSAARGQGGGGGGITSLNDIIGTPTSDLVVIGAEGSNFVQKTLTAGTNVTLTETPTTITIAASGGSSSTAQIVTATVVNAESVAITRGQVVYAYAATGNLVSVKLAYNTSDATSAKTFGVVSDNSIAAGASGTVTCIGVVDKLNLGAYSEGDTVYLSATPGAFTATKPYAPNHLVYVGIVERANAGNGQLYVKVQNGYELDEIHDVQIITPPAAGAVLVRDATNSLWKAAQIAGTANQITVTNADAAVTLSLPTAITNVNSLTATAATNLTLSGGSSGASIVAGQGTNGSVTITPTGTGAFAVNSTGLFSEIDLNASGVANGYFFYDTSTTTVGIGSVLNRAVKFVVNASEKARFTATNGNLLIGGTTDITGAGGLKVFGTTAASSTTSGALQVAGGVGVAGALYTGGNLAVNGGTITTTSGQAMTFPQSGAGAFIVGNNAEGGTLQVLSNNISTLSLKDAGGSPYELLLRIGSGAFEMYDATAAASRMSINSTTATFTGNLTVSGTGNNTFAGGLVVGTGYGFSTTGWLLYQSGIYLYLRDTVNGAMAMRLDPGTSPSVTITNSLAVSGTTDSSSTTTGSLVVSGGLGLAKKLYVGGNVIYMTGAGDQAIYTNSTQTLFLGVQGVGVIKINGADGAVSTAFPVSITNTTESTSSTTGALVVSGGLGVAKKATFGGGINGTTTNDSAAAGCVGEYVSSSIGYGGRQALTTGTWLNVTSISLTAGDWDVSGTVVYEGTGATITRFSGAATTTSLAPDADNDTFDNRQSITTSSGNVGAFPIPTRRVSISATTTIYLISRGYFSAGTLETYGRILARRVR